MSTYVTGDSDTGTQRVSGPTAPLREFEMKIRGFWVKAILIAVAALSCTLAVQAQVTVVDTELGGSFAGTIVTAGGDVVQGRFYAAGGELVKMTVQAARGSSLVPTATIRDAGGAPVAGTSRSLSWMGVGNVIHAFTVPGAGWYLAEIGGASGSGSFKARLSGTAVQAPPPTEVAVSGTVTDSATTNPIAGATVTVNAVAYDTTDAAGNFSGTLDPGNYTFAFSAAGYTSANQMVAVAAGTPINDLDVALDPLPASVLVEASATGDMTPGGVVNATVDVTGPAGLVINSYTWTQEYGADATIAGGNTAAATVTLAGLGNYKAALIHHLEAPPVTADQLPPNVPLPPGEFHGGLQDRLQAVGINPFALEEAALVVLHVEVDTSAGVFSDEVEIHAGVPWKWASGLRNVPTNVPVLLQAVEHTSYAWTMFAPSGSTAVLMDADTRHPYFTPDLEGRYRLTLADVPSGVNRLDVYAGIWRGIIVDQDMDGRPVYDDACLLCHTPDLGGDKFVDWAQTGHAEIFTNNLNTSTHYGPNCFPCHTVGYDTSADNAGIDEATDYPDFLDSGLINNPGDNWTTVLDQYPETARLANIQCENCHGPQDSLGHGFGPPSGTPRIDISSDVCATCHGEPLRHARFQQWQLSGHANYELAIDEHDRGSCSKCHTGNGFLAWLPVLLDNDPLTDPQDDVNVTWTAEETHPQTCVTCHDPHANGTTTGVDTDATVRITRNTPPLAAGFTARNVGRGAICMTCHNSRRGERNDSVWDALTDKERAPHGSAQTDMIMGENAYLIEVGQRGGHSYIEDTCVDCHMNATPPPAVLSYNQGGTNHTFFAQKEICGECHSPNLLAGDVQDGIQFLMDTVEEMLVEEYFAIMEQEIGSGNRIDLNGSVFITDAADIDEIQLTESRGRQALAVTVSGTPVGARGLHQINVQEWNGAAWVTIAPIRDFAHEDLLKSGWNFFLVHNDGSTGVHNPFFANSALIAARDAIVALDGPGAAASRRAFSKDRPGIGGIRMPTPMESRRSLRR